MFWGLILKHNKKYSQSVKKAFHLSAASLDISQVKSGEDVQVLLNSDDNVYLLCTLNKDKIPQCSLDLNFAEGDKICFSIKGEGIVHLTGFLIPDADFLDEEEDEDEVETEIAQATKKKVGGGSAMEKKGQKNALAKLISNDQDSDSDEMDDTFDPEKIQENEEDSSDDDEDAEEEAEGSDDEEEDDDDEEEEDDDDDEEENDDEEEEEELETPAKKIKLQEKQKQSNGLENGKAASKEHKQKEKGQKGGEQQGGAKTLTGGVQVQDLKQGNGPAALAGKKVTVYYEGRLKQNNKVFDSTKSGAGFKFRLGGGEVIKGWDVGLVGMKVGGKRRVTCPPNMAYGQKGSPPVIPPNSTLVFDVELRNVN